MTVKSRNTEILLLILASVIVGAFLTFLAVISPGIEGGMDSYNHYLIARWSWVYPERLLLDQWGKPVYNIIASPFAQFGIMGVEILNILLLIGSAWFTWLICRKLNIRNAWLGFLITLLSPIILVNTISGLTEPLNAFLLLGTIWLLIDDRYIAGAIATGFLPYARSEGYVIMAVIGLFLLWKSEYRAFFFLLLGSVVMNTIGWIVEGDPKWLYTSNPYIKIQAEKGSSCGHGSLLHYIHALPYTFGRLVSLLFVVGSAVTGYRFVKNRYDDREQKILFLLIGVFALYFAIHALIWYLGLMGSCGYERVMTVIAPLLSIVALIGFNFIFSLIQSGNILWLSSEWRERIRKIVQSKIFKIVVFTAFAGILLYEPYRWYGPRYPLEISKEQQLFRETAQWFNATNYKGRKVYHLYPYFSILTDENPYDVEKHIDLWSFDAQYAPPGSIVIWDSHFGPNESKLPLEQLKENPDFTLIRSFVPKEPFPTLNSDTFEIHVFERTGDRMLKR